MAWQPPPGYPPYPGQPAPPFFPPAPSPYPQNPYYPLLFPPPPGFPEYPPYPMQNYGPPGGPPGGPPQALRRRRLGPPQGYPPPGGYPGYGAPQQPVHAGPPVPPSPGYIPGQRGHTDMNGQAVKLRDSMKGFGTNEAKLIAALAQVHNPLDMAQLRFQYDDRFRRDLIKDIKSETGGDFEEALCAVVRGPLGQDVYALNRSLAGVGTKEDLLNDVLLGRSNADLKAIMGEYQKMYRKDLGAEVRGDLSMKTAKLFEYVMAANRAEESAPVIPQQTDADVDRLQQATEGTKFGTNQDVVVQVLAQRSNGQIRAIAQAYQSKYRRSLDEVLKKEFSGHMEDALRLMLGRAVDPVKTDADQLEASMKGLGTKDELLIHRVVQIHWDRNRMQQVRNAYRQFYKKDLVKRIEGETRGDYEKLLVALVV
ncbi:Annexin [Eremomyces bilateralis CBS 781.70]|uniref:Annexin n=1 Tax=Eremomyces bilateralis CBS 781.70 TaxID=1392243 RepID=A0A6G1GEW6_9PEZI|nr:Annexin [Eremomyces bilateralis CBS 781.70]KAF1816655.1 Annexin [Eremomyces bilateralis CBS 781.70]